MTDAEQSILICQPVVSGESDDSAVPSSRMWCHLCATEVWVSDTMAPLVLGGEMKPTCWDCADGIIGADPEGAEFRLHPKQRPELVALRIDQFAQHHIEHMNRRTRRKKKK